jgi:hypothetical protein
MADFSNVSSRGRANIVVTDKIFGEFDDSSFYDGSAWTSWAPDDFPGLGYTLRFRHIS